ncbi:MAG: DUF4252 domain-containing protein [Pseudomonadota bacterium]
MRLFIMAVVGVFVSSALTISMLSYAEDSELSKLPGYFEFADLESTYGKPSLKINLNKSLLKLVGSFDHEDPAVAETLKNLELVRVYAFEDLGEGSSFNKAEQQMLELTASLEAASWSRVVEARDEEERVDIYVKQSAESIQGLVLLALDGEDAVFINVLGNIQPQQIASIVKHVDIDLDIPL